MSHPSSLTPLTQPTHLSSLSISHILRSHRFTASTSSAHYTLTTLLERYLAVLATACVAHASDASRSSVGVWDVLTTLEEFGMGVDELKDWIEVNKDEQGGMGSLGVTSGLDGLRDHLSQAHHSKPPSIPLRYKRVRHRHLLQTPTSPTLSPQSRSREEEEEEEEEEEDSTDSEASHQSSNLSVASMNRKRKRDQDVRDVQDLQDVQMMDSTMVDIHDTEEEKDNINDHQQQRSSTPTILPWLPPLPSTPSNTTNVDSPPKTPSPPFTTHTPSSPPPPTPRPRSTRSQSFAPPRRSAIHAYLASPVEYNGSMLSESHIGDTHLKELSSRVEQSTTVVPELLPTTITSLIEAYENVIENNRTSTREEIESAKGGLDHRIGIADILARTSNHPMTYSGVSSKSSSTDVIGGAIGVGPLSKGNHFIPSYPIYEDGSPADEYPVKRVTTTTTSSTSYIPTLAYTSTSTGTSAPLSNPTNPSTFRPLRSIVAELPGKMKLARPNPQSSNFWFEPTNKRSEWLTPDILEMFTHMQPPPPLIGKKGTAEEDRKLLYGEGVVAPGWTKEMKVPAILRMEDDLPSNAIGSESSSWVNPTVAAMMTGKGKGGREHGEEELSRAAAASMTDTVAPPIAPLQPLIQLKSTWDIKDRGNWRVWVKPGSKTRGRVLSKQEGQMLDINVKGDDVEEELEEDEEDEMAVGTTPNVQGGGGNIPHPMDTTGDSSVQTPGPRLKLISLNRPSPAPEQPIEPSIPPPLSTPRVSFSMPPPNIPMPMESPMSTPAPFKLKFKLGGPLTPSTPATPSTTSIQGPAGVTLGPRLGSAEAQPSQSAPQDDYFSLGPRAESAPAAAQNESRNANGDANQVA